MLQAEIIMLQATYLARKLVKYRKNFKTQQPKPNNPIRKWARDMCRLCRVDIEIYSEVK